jgi:hypothetical protein
MTAEECSDVGVENFQPLLFGKNNMNNKTENNQMINPDTHSRQRANEAEGGTH